MDKLLSAASETCTELPHHHCSMLVEPLYHCELFTMQAEPIGVQQVFRIQYRLIIGDALAE